MRRVCVSAAIKLQAISEVMFIDTGNAFSLSYIERYMRQRVDISKIRIARPFSLEQLKRVIDNIPSEATGSKVLVISSIDGMVASKHPKDAYFIMSQILAKINHLTKTQGLITVLAYDNVLPLSLLEKHIDSAYLL